MNSKIKYTLIFLLIFTIFPLTSALGDNLNIYFPDGITVVNATDICVQGGTLCLSSTSAGDIIAVNTDGPYLYGGVTTGAANLYLNASALNSTIAALSIGNASWTQILADGLYAGIGVTGDNSSWNQILADGLYADIGVTTDNSSWSETYAKTIFNQSFNQTLTDGLYAGIGVTGDNSSWNQILADGLYADIGVTTDNSSWNEVRAGTLYIFQSKEGDLNVNGSDHWDDYAIANATWFENIGNALSLKISQLETWANGWFSTKNTDDLPEGSTNLYDNSSWSEDYASARYVNLSGDIMTGDLSTSGTFNGAFNWTSADDYSTFDGSALTFNQSKFEVQYFNATSLYVVTGTSAGTLENIQTKDGVAFNITEVASDVELLVNFTGITEFSSLLVRHKTDVQNGHTMTVQVWDYDNARWEGYGIIAETLTSEGQTFGVYDDSIHIDGGVVQVRIFQDEGVPASTHLHSFDWVGISKGFGTPIAGELDPYSFHIGENLDNSGYNISADYFIGDGSLLNNTGVNTSWAQTLADTLYANIGVTTDNSSWNEVRADTLYAGIGITADNESWSETYAKTIFNQSFNQSWTDTQYRIATWDNFTGIPTATPSNGDTTHLSTADHIYDWVTANFLAAMDYTSLALTNITNTFSQPQTFQSNITVEEIVFETAVTNSIRDNATCVILGGATSRFEVC